MVNPVKNNAWYRSILGTLNHIDSDKISYDIIEKGERATQEEFDDAVKDAKEISPFGKKDENSKGIMDYLNRFKTNNNPNEDILYKNNKNINKSEADKASKYAWFEGKDKDLNNKISGKVSSWYDDIYGKSEAAKDATGRIINPKESFKIAEEEVPLRTKEGKDLMDGFQAIAGAMFNRDESEGRPNGALALQRGLNGFEYTPQLKEDGDAGPKTTSRLKQAMAEQGLNTIMKRLQKRNA